MENSRDTVKVKIKPKNIPNREPSAWSLIDSAKKLDIQRAEKGANKKDREEYTEWK